MLYCIKFINFIFCVIFAGHGRPTLKYLNRYVRQSLGSRWHDLGIELLEADSVEILNRINSENPKDQNACCTKMFQLWLSVQPMASWNQLIESLRQPSIGLKQLSDKIGHMLVQTKYKSTGKKLWFLFYVPAYMYTGA